MIKENILKIKEYLSNLHIDSQAIVVIAISKNRPIEQIKQAIEAGITDIGENKVQEAVSKYNAMRYALCGKPIRWHMVGHLQANKIKQAVKIFDLIHSVDTLRLAEEINKQAAKINKIQDILIEVNTSGETTKFGFKPEEAIAAVRQIAGLKNVNLKGLMTVAPIVDSPEQARPYFKLLRELREQINTLHITRYTLHILSMGMTDDFAAAIQEGANMLRLGRAIFEA
ncbi:MAG: YggS family pyridoxal phosphate-dependent enzyme [Candidatus Omnitrophota bacterium]